ncbi:hypothetical protein EsH8_IV_000825 [Colletotrichum jinshuiense]
MTNRVAGTAGKGKMREVETPPLCASCFLGVEGEDVLQKGLRRVEKVDGGLSRARWEAGEGRTGQLRRVSAVGYHLWDRGPLLILEQSVRSLSRDSSTMRRTGDGTQDESGRHLATPETTIYVSINDPMGQPAFKASPTKPIPAWMQPFRGIAQPYDQWPVESTPPHRPVGIAQTPTTPKSGISILESTKSLTPAYRPITPVQSSSRLHTRAGSPSVWTPSELKRAQPISWVSHEPLKRPSSRLAARLDKSDATASSGYVTPPETPSEQIMRYKTPPPQLRRTRPQSPLATSRVLRRNAVRRTPPPQSSEYLERYNPIRSPSPRLRTKEPVISALRRASRAGANLGFTREATVVAEGSTWDSEQSTERPLADGADSPRETGKKKNMQALRKLFGGK